MGARFSATVQKGSESHPALHTMGTRSFTGVKRPGRAVDYPPRSSAKVNERVELYLYSPCGFSWPVLRGTLLYVKNSRSYEVLLGYNFVASLTTIGEVDHLRIILKT